jgi:hypothetical protein
MALVPFADIDALPPKAKDYWDKLTAKLNIFRMLANADTMMEPALRFGGAILSKQQLGADLRELVILLVAELEGGEYEWNQHVPIGLRCGNTQAQIDALAVRRFGQRGFPGRGPEALQPQGDRRDHPDLRLLHDHGPADRNHPHRYRPAGRRADRRGAQQAGLTTPPPGG